MREEISHDHPLKKISGIHSFPEYFHFFQKGSHKSHNLDPDQNPLEKIKLVIELKFMEKSAKTVRWVLDKVIFLATCFE